MTCLQEQAGTPQAPSPIRGLGSVGCSIAEPPPSQYLDHLQALGAWKLHQQINGLTPKIRLENANVITGHAL